MLVKGKIAKNKRCVQINYSSVVFTSSKGYWPSGFHKTILQFFIFLFMSLIMFKIISGRAVDFLGVPRFIEGLQGLIMLFFIIFIIIVKLEELYVGRF